MHNCRKVGKNKNNKKPQEQKETGFRGRSYMRDHLVILLSELGLLLHLGNTKGRGLYIQGGEKVKDYLQRVKVMTTMVVQSAEINYGGDFQKRHNFV